MKGEDIWQKTASHPEPPRLSRSFQITNVFHELSVLDNIRAGVRSRCGLTYHFFRQHDHNRMINEKTLKLVEEVLSKTS